MTEMENRIAVKAVVLLYKLRKRLANDHDLSRMATVAHKYKAEVAEIDELLEEVEDNPPQTTR